MVFLLFEQVESSNGATFMFCQAGSTSYSECFSGAATGAVALDNRLVSRQKGN